MIRLLTQTSYNRSRIKSLLEPVLCSPSMQERLGTGSGRVLLKPNFVMPAPRSDASTTHPEFYMAIAELLLAQGLTVGIGESPAFGTCRKALQAHGVLSECQDLGIDVVEFSRMVEYQGVQDERFYSSLTVAGELQNWEHVINLPKLKTHQQFTFTAACKNLYGCVAGKRKFVRHNLCGNDPVRFAKMIIANAMQINSTLHIADGIEAMHVKGPRSGESFPLNRVIVAEDPLALDWLFCQLTDLDPLQTPLFQALDAKRVAQVASVCEPISRTKGGLSVAPETELQTDVADAVDSSAQHRDSDAFYVASDFIHAPLIHISFSPWAIARSGWRTVKYAMKREARGHLG